MKFKKLKNFSLYNLFSNKRNDLKDAPKEDTKPTLKRFFKLLYRKFWNLITLNLVMLPMVLPILIAFFVYMAIDKTPSESQVIFSQLYGANLIQATPDSTFLLDMFGSQYMIPAYNSVGTYIGIGICALFLLITFGWQNVGAAYILRGLVRGDPVFIFADYFYAIKRNLKQGFFLGVLDFSVIFLLAFDFMFFWGRTGSFGQDLMFWGIAALAIIYFFMRFYLYLLQITFHLSIRKILKNALIFTTLGIKRNLMAFFGIVLLAAFAIALIAFFVVLFGFNMIAIPAILPCFYFLSFSSFMAAYAAYPIIDRYMIAPYAPLEKEETDEEAEASSSDAE